MRTVVTIAACVQDGGDELERLQQEAERILAEARAEAQKMVADARAAGLEASNAEVAKVKAVCFPAFGDK